MKRTIKNIFKNILIVASLLLSNGNLLAMDATQPPQRLHNAEQHWNGICFANSALQCLFQNNHLCGLIDNLQRANPAWQELYRLRSGQALSTRERIPCAKEVVGLIKREFPGSDVFIFTHLLINNLLQIQRTIGRTYSYDHPNQCIYQTNLNIAGGGIISEIPDVLHPAIRKITENERFNFNANLIIAPELNLIVVSPTQDLSGQIASFENMYRNSNALLSRVYNHATGQENNLNIELKGVVVSCKSGQGDHALAYALHRGQAFLCSDDLIVESVGNGFGDISNHLHANLVPHLNRTFANTTFTTASPVLFFYEVSQAPGTMTAAVAPAPAPAPARVAPAKQDDNAKILEQIENGNCPICTNLVTKWSYLEPCKHVLCQACITEHMKPKKVDNNIDSDLLTAQELAAIRQQGYMQKDLQTTSKCPFCVQQIEKVIPFSIRQGQIIEEAPIQTPRPQAQPVRPRPLQQHQPAGNPFAHINGGQSEEEALAAVLALSAAEAQPRIPQLADHNLVVAVMQNLVEMGIQYIGEEEIFQIIMQGPANRRVEEIVGIVLQEVFTPAPSPGELADLEFARRLQAEEEAQRGGPAPAPMPHVPAAFQQVPPQPYHLPQPAGYPAAAADQGHAIADYHYHGGPVPQAGRRDEFLRRIEELTQRRSVAMDLYNESTVLADEYNRLLEEVLLCYGHLQVIQPITGTIVINSPRPFVPLADFIQEQR